MELYHLGRIFLFYLRILRHPKNVGRLNLITKQQNLISFQKNGD